jgi:hypothetical protein
MENPGEDDCNSTEDATQKELRRRTLTRKPSQLLQSCDKLMLIDLFPQGFTAGISNRAGPY